MQIKSQGTLLDDEEIATIAAHAVPDSRQHPNRSPPQFPSEPIAGPVSSRQRAAAIANIRGVYVRSALSQDYGAFEYMHQFPDVARPVVCQ